MSQLLPPIELPHEIIPLCQELQRLLEGEYRHSVSASQYDTAKNYLLKIKALSTNRVAASDKIARFGGYYEPTSGLILNLQTDKRVTRDQALEIIDQFLVSIRDAMHKLAHHRALPILFNEMGAFRPCILAKSAGVLSAADQIAKNDDSFKDENALMHAIFGELELHTFEGDNDQITAKIIEAYDGQTFLLTRHEGANDVRYTVSQENVSAWVEVVFGAAGPSAGMAAK